MEKIKIFAASQYAEEFTKEICDYLKINMGNMKSIKFKNDNNFVQISESVREHDVYIIQTTTPPVNERLMELFIIIDAMKRATARRINVVLPYYPYSRSDKKDQPRIPVTSKLVAQLLEAAGADRIITCDLHNPAIQAYFNIQCDRLTGEYLLEKYFEDKGLKDIVVVATDAGSSKKAYKYSEFFRCPMALIDKRRYGNNDNVKAINIIGDVKGKNALIFDDEISTGGTIIEAVNIVKAQGAKTVYAACVHPVLCGEAVEKIKNSQLEELVVTNTIPIENEKKIGKIKILSIAPLFAETIKRNNEAKSIDDLFRVIE